MQIIVRRFEVSNSARCPCSDDYGKEWYNKSLNRLVAPSNIENEINKVVSHRGDNGLKISPPGLMFYSVMRCPNCGEQRVVDEEHKTNI